MVRVLSHQSLPWQPCTARVSPSGNTSVTLQPALPWRTPHTCNEVRKSALLIPLASSLPESGSKTALFSPTSHYAPRKAPFAQLCHVSISCSSQDGSSGLSCSRCCVSWGCLQGAECCLGFLQSPTRFPRKRRPADERAPRLRCLQLADPAKLWSDVCCSAPSQGQTRVEKRKEKAKRWPGIGAMV